MAANLADVALMLGLGGTLGALAALYSAGKRFADHLGELASAVEKALRDPAHSDLNAAVARARQVEAEARSLLGMIKKVIKV